MEDQGTSRYTIPAWSRGRDLHPPQMAYETMLELPPVHPATLHSIVKELVGAAGFEPAYLLRPKQAASHLPTPRRPDTSKSNRESFAAKVTARLKTKRPDLLDPAFLKFGMLFQFGQVTSSGLHAPIVTRVRVPCGSVPKWITCITHSNLNPTYDRPQDF